MNKSYTTLSTATPHARSKPAVPPSASFTEGHDTLTYITTHLPPATPSPPSSPGTPLTQSSSSSSLPAVASEHKHDDMNDAMIVSNDDDEDDDDDDDDDDDEDVNQLALASATLPSAPSISFLIPQYDKLHQPTTPAHTSHVSSSSPTHSTPLLPSNAPTSSRLHRRLRKLAYFLSTSPVLLIGSCVFLMLLSGVNSLLWVSISARYGLQHAYLLNQLSTLLFLLFCLPVVLLRSSSLSSLSLSSFLSAPLLLVGFLDALYGLFITLGSSRTPGPFQLLLYQFSLLFSFLFSSLLAPSQVRWKHVLGCLLIFLSSLVAMIPDVVSSKQTDSMDELMGLLVYFIGVFFFSVNCVLKENLLKDPSVDIFALSIIDQTLVFSLTFACIPLLFIPHVSLDTPATFLPHVASGLSCFFMSTPGTNDRAQSELPAADTDACDGVWLPTLLFSLSNVLLQSVMLFVLRISSSFTLNVLSTLQLPLSSLLLSSPLMGSGRSQLTLASIVGMVGVSLGSGVYGWAEAEKGKEEAISIGAVAEGLTEQRRLVVQTSAVGVTPAVTPRAAVRLDSVRGRGLRFDRVLEGEEEEYGRAISSSRHTNSSFISLFTDVQSGQDSVLYDSDLEESLDDDDIK